MITFSDLHLREDSEEVVFDEVLPGIRRACHEHEDKDVGFLGDFWHLRYTLNVRLFNRVRDEFQAWSDDGIRLRLLVGNHDQVDINGRNALEALAGIRNVSVYTNPTWDSDGLWIPYRKRNEDILFAVRSERPTGPHECAPVAFMHHGVKDAMMNNHHANTEGLPPSAFQKFERVLCGHYHMRQTLGNVTYIGSPWQTKADESGQPKGYALWDGKNLRFVDTDWGRKFHRIELQKGEKLDLSGIDSRDEVRITTAPGVDPEKIGKQLAGAGIEHHTVTPQEQHFEQRLTAAPGAALDSYAMAYVDAVPTELDKDRLKTVFQEIAQHD